MPFWKTIFDREYSYLYRSLTGYKKVLSVGCGPAVIEGKLAEYGFEVTGLDISKEALNEAPASIRKIVGTAEMTDFPNASFDAVIYVASLQFIDNYRKALTETARVLIPERGKLIAMLLNTESLYFDEQTRDPESYMCKIKHKNLNHIEIAIASYFNIRTEYYMGIVGEKIFESDDPKLASLYIINGIKK
jgi:ubiquinone/menaquinone biosynthesis C-methylase UbiE